MPSINFRKTDEYVRQIAKQRKKDNDEFYQNNLKNLAEEENEFLETTIDESSVISDDGFYIFDQNEYKHTKFNDLFIGIENATTEESFVIISNTRFCYCNFKTCGFSNIKFENCFFVGCDIIECYTLGLGIVFSNCHFMRGVPGKNSIDDMPTIITDCDLITKFRNCDLSQVVAEKTHFYFSTFENVNAHDMILIDCSLDIFTISDSDLRKTKFANPKFIDFNIEDNIRRTKVDKNTFLGLINFDKKEERDIKTATEVYAAFSELYENNKISFLSGEYFYLCRRTELLSLKGTARLKSILGLITCGYGERPFFSLLTSLFLILLCGTLYLLLGVSQNNEILIYRPTSSHLLPDFNDFILCYHFSLVTFSTVGYGNITPVGGSLYVSACEMVIGVIMVGIWVSTLVRKMVK